MLTQNDQTPKTRLPARILRDLYANVLVGSPPRSDSSADLPASGSDISSYTLGENQKNILILVHDPESATIAPTQLAFLLNILKACRLGMPDVRILNLHAAPEKDHASLQLTHQPRVCLLFGVNPVDLALPMHFPTYQLQEFQSVTYICAPALSALETDDAGKKSLWSCLKQVFLK